MSNVFIVYILVMRSKFPPKLNCDYAAVTELSAHMPLILTLRHVNS